MRGLEVGEEVFDVGEEAVAPNAARVRARLAHDARAVLVEELVVGCFRFKPFCIP